MASPFYLFEFEQNVRNTVGLYIHNIQPGDKTKGDFHFILKRIISMNQQILKQVVGIDVSQKELVVCFGRMTDALCPQLCSHASFANTPAGMQKLVSWAVKQKQADRPLRFVMEATGVYHESLAYFLSGQGHPLSIVLPNKISNYVRTLETRTVTDKTAAQAITLFGLERQLSDWQPPRPELRKLRQLTREREQLVATRTMVKNQLHAEKAGAMPSEETISRMKKHVVFLNQQITQIQQSITTLVRQQEELKTSLALCCSVPGVGQLTAAIVLAETNGFELIRNKKQLVSFAGLDVREKQSGTSVRGKPRISKKGNRFLRKAMHMPALGAIRSDERLKGVFSRLVAKHGIKMKAVVAVQRKVLELIYTVYKTQRPYDHQYHKKLESSTTTTL